MRQSDLKAPRVLVLGATGMLGTAVMEEFSSYVGSLIGTVRSEALISHRGVRLRTFDAENASISSVSFDLEPGDYLINCIGLIKTEIVDSDPKSRSRAIAVNSALPTAIAIDAEQRGYKVIQIATDCVFNGDKGDYSEESDHDPRDVYGKTKSLGEVLSPNAMNLRVSIIGPEIRGFTSLYEWVAKQPRDSKIVGFSNHFWNGITTRHFAKIARAVVEKNLFKPGTHHVLPSNAVSKEELLRLIAKRAGRSDVKIRAGEAPFAVNRTLSTLDPAFNRKLWRGAGYTEPPTIAELVSEI